MHLRKQLQQIDCPSAQDKSEQAACLALLARKTKSLQNSEIADLK